MVTDPTVEKFAWSDGVFAEFFARRKDFSAADMTASERKAFIQQFYALGGPGAGEGNEMDYREKVQNLANPYHDERGRFTNADDAATTSGDGADSKARVDVSKADALEKATWKPNARSRPEAIKVSDPHQAVDLILKGKVVELKEVRQVHTVLSKLAKIAEEAKALGKDAPNYDLCQVTVAGSNLFCISKLRDAEHPNGVPRIEMPQMSGDPVPGSRADKLPRNKNGQVDATKAFIRHLTNLGIKAEEINIPASRLKASQAELVGPKVAGMMASKTYDPAKEPVFVSRDHYVVDGHHRWAAVVGRDSEDGHLGDSKMKTIKLDAPISEILHIANEWAKDFGIASKAAGKGAKLLSHRERLAILLSE